MAYTELDIRPLLQAFIDARQARKAFNSATVTTASGNSTTAYNSLKAAIVAGGTAASMATQAQAYIDAETTYRQLQGQMNALDNAVEAARQAYELAAEQIATGTYTPPAGSGGGGP